MSIPQRIDSIDVFRGLTMFLMLFVNDLNDPTLGHIADVPAWLNHMPAKMDGMTFVDVILPAFLFSVGLCIPLALAKRMESKGVAGAVIHIIVRSLGLVVIGLGMVNTYRFHPTAMPVSPGLWRLFFYIAVILVWNQYPRKDGKTKGWHTGLRVAGGVLLLLLAFIYRGSEGGVATWMRTSWGGILTIIGFAYFIAAMAYLLLKKNLAGMIGLLVVLTALNIGDRTGALSVLDPLRRYFSAGGMLGGMPSITVAGVVGGMLFMDEWTGRNARLRLQWLLGFALTLALCGLLLRYPLGISKLAVSPAWCLLSAAICCTLFTFLYWLVDLKDKRAWASFVRPVGRQPLLAYFLPHIFYSLLAVAGITLLEQHFNAGMPGILRSLLLALALIGVTQLLTRLNVLLRL
jgi:heparan-alpha-glucosaminide N-acetyltransferase